MQGKDPSVDITQDIVDDEEDDLAGRLDESAESLQRQVSPCNLPPCELGELEEIAEMFSSSLPSPVRREQLARAVEGSDYITKLLTLFRTCEDLEDTESLHKLFEIVKCLFLFNRSALFDVMLQEGHIMDVVGCLEFDPSLAKPQKHRDYLLHEVNFKEVLPIKNPDLLKKIHQTFRLQYIQDVVLPTPSVFEENLLSTLSSIIFFNKVSILLRILMIQMICMFRYFMISQHKVFLAFTLTAINDHWPLWSFIHLTWYLSGTSKLIFLLTKF